jgi:hypothetical protein
MDTVDLRLFDAERAGDNTTRAALLRQRAALWRRYGRLLESAGAESYGSELCARRDETDAGVLEAAQPHVQPSGRYGRGVDTVKCDDCGEEFAPDSSPNQWLCWQCDEQRAEAAGTGWFR